MASPAGNGGGGTSAPASAGPNNPNHGNGNEGGTGPLHGNGGGNGGGGGGNGNGGTTAQVPVSSWTHDYQQWLKDHPHPGNNPNAGSVNAPNGVNQWNQDYHAWLQQHPNPGNNAGGGGNGNHGGNGNNGPGGVDIGVPPYATGGISPPADPVTPADPTAPADTSQPPNNTDGTGGLQLPDILGNLSGGLPGFDPEHPLSSLANQQPGQTVAPAANGGNSGGLPTSILDKIPVLPGLPTHIVTPGDTLSGIAQQNGVSLADLHALNPQIADPNLIFPGQAINLGSQDANAAPAAGGIAPPETAPGFPTSSTYPPADEEGIQGQSVGKLRGFGQRLRGWGAGGNMASDPARNAMYISSERNTNPLDIKDSKNRGQDQNTPG